MVLEVVGEPWSQCVEAGDGDGFSFFSFVKPLFGIVPGVFMCFMKRHHAVTSSFTRLDRGASSWCPRRAASLAVHCEQSKSLVFDLMDPTRGNRVMESNGWQCPSILVLDGHPRWALRRPMK